MKRPNVHWAKKLFYNALKGIVLLMNAVFYEQMKFIDKERLKLDRPTILVSNHPSTMMDPVNVAARVNRYVHFLANAGLFQSGFTNWFFSTFFCFPVQRKKDIGKRQIDNQKSFQKSFQFLADGGCLFIAPEGVSTPEHDLKALKTGTARIALGAEAAFNNSLNLQILPVGIYYSDAQSFRSKVVKVVGAPIEINEWAEAFEQDERQATHGLTELLQQQMESLIINIDGPEQDLVLRRAEKILNIKNKVQLLDQYKRTKRLADSIRDRSFKHDNLINNFFEKLEKESLTAETIFGSMKFRWWNLLLPLAVVGSILNLIPILIIKGIEKTAGLYQGYTSTLQSLLGIILLPIFYKLNNVFLSKLPALDFNLGNWWPLTWSLYLLLGLFAFYYFRSINRGWKKWRWRNFLSKTPEGLAIQAEAKNILEQLTPYI